MQMTFIDIAAIGTISSYLTLSVVESVRVYRDDKEPTFIGLVFSTIYETVKFGIEFVHDLLLDIKKKKLNVKKPSVTEEYYIDNDIDIWDLEESYESASEAEDYELII